MVNVAGPKDGGNRARACVKSFRVNVSPEKKSGMASENEAIVRRNIAEAWNGGQCEVLECC